MSALDFDEENGSDYYLPYLTVLLNEMTSDNLGHVPSLPKAGNPNNLKKDVILEEFQAIFAEPKVNFFFFFKFEHCLSNVKLQRFTLH